MVVVVFILLYLLNLSLNKTQAFRHILTKEAKQMHTNELVLLLGCCEPPLHGYWRKVDCESGCKSYSIIKTSINKLLWFLQHSLNATVGGGSLTGITDQI